MDGVTVVGVPLMAPEAVSKVKPAGRIGETVHDVTAPPVAVGVTVFMETPFVNVNELGL